MNTYELKRTGQFGHYEVWIDGIVALSPTNEKMGKEYIEKRKRETIKNCLKMRNLRLKEEGYL